MSSAWASKPADRFHWLHGDDEHVVYNEASGQTHLIDALSAQILLSLGESGPLCFDALVNDLGRELMPEESARLPALTARRLRDLDLLGLVHRSR